MSGSDNDVILCADVSGSVGECANYYAHIKEILEQLQNESRYPKRIITWSSGGAVLDTNNFISKYVNKLRGDGGTEPQKMVSYIDELALAASTEKVDLYITTDGEISPTDTEVYCEDVKKLSSLNKISEVKLYFVGNPMHMNTNLAHAFEKTPITVAINEHIIRSKRNIAILNDERYINFKLENVPILVDELALEFSLMPNTVENKCIIREQLDAIKGKYLQALFDSKKDTADPSEINQINKKPDEIIHELLEAEKIEELKKFYCKLFTIQKEDIYDKKINILYSLLSKGNVLCYDLMMFIPSALNTSLVQNRLQGNENLNESEDEEGDNFDDDGDMDDREKFCAIYYIESKLPVIQLQKDEHEKVINIPSTEMRGSNRKLAKCPLMLLEFIHFENLGATVLTDHISAEAFIKLSEERYSNLYTFKSTCNTEAYGIMVYNFENPQNVDLYRNKETELYKPKTELDDNIVKHTCRIIANYFFGTSYIIGNKALWAITFLYAIYKTDRIQENEHLKNCLRYTIIRISLVFKCNLAVFKGVHPQILINIHDAFLCALHVASTVFQTENNFARKLEESGPLFVHMMKTIFKQQIPSEICFDEWVSWKYLFRKSLEAKNRNTMLGIIKTRFQDWIKTLSGPLLIEGRTTDDVFDDAIKDTNIDILYKMVKILKDREIKVSKNFNFNKIKLDVCVDDLKTVQIHDSVDHHKRVKICKSTCRPTYYCSSTKKPWNQCISEEMRVTAVSFFNLYGKYVRKFKKFPTKDDLLNHFVLYYPDQVYYRNTEEIIDEVVKKFEALQIDVKTFYKNFTSAIEVENRIKIEEKCDCNAHA